MDNREIAKTIETSANLITGIIDRFFPYCGLTKKALDVYISEIERSDKPKEFKAWEIMNAKREFKKLQNINSIVELAKEYCSEEEIDKASYSDNEEWYDYFFEKAGNVSAEGVQRIWGQILASEIKENGKTPRSVISVLSEIDSELAKAFSVLCEHRLIIAALDVNGKCIGGTVSNDVIKFDDNEYYRNKGLDLLTMNELESIGLISTNGVGYIRRIPGAKKALISDGVFTECITLKKEEINQGTLLLTRAGSYLLNIINPGLAHDQREVVKSYYLNHGYKTEESPYKVRLIDNGHIQITKNN
jgi:hypothetical protein